MATSSHRQDDPNERRRFKRTRVILAGRLQAGDQTLDGHILDISANGVKLRLPEPPRKSPTLTLRLARSIDVPADTAWRKGNILGLRFRESPAHMASVLAGLLAAESLPADGLAA